MKRILFVALILLSIATSASAAHELTCLPNIPEIRSLATTLIDAWEEYRATENPHFEVEKLASTIDYAAVKHAGQTRDNADKTPYIIHPLQVCHNLWEIGKVRNANILAAALLHDTLEDTSATEEEITTLFGSRVCTTVQEVTNVPSLPSQEQKLRQIEHVPTMSQDARLVKLADRLANITDLTTHPPQWSQAQIDRYFGWGRKLLTALRGTNSQMEAALESRLNGENVR